MFAIIDPVGNRATYVPGMFGKRDSSAVEKISPAKPVAKDPFQGAQHASNSASLLAQNYEALQSGQYPEIDTLQGQEIMSSPVYALPMTASLTEAWAFLQERRFRHIPIQTKDSSLGGILSDRDLARATVNSALAGVKGASYLDQISIQAYVKSPVLVAKPETKIWSIAKVLLDERIGAMPIMGSQGDLVGMITRTDILRALVAHPNFHRWI